MSCLHPKSGYDRSHDKTRTMTFPVVQLLALLTGSIVGSFLTLLADRWPRGEDWVATPSHCRACGHRLSAAQLIPLISFAVQRGRCAWCRTPLPADLWLGELGGAIVAVIAVGAGGNPAGIAALALFGAALLVLALLDARHLWLPDAITLPLIVLGLAAAWVLPDIAWPERAAGAALGWAALEGLRRTYRRLRGRDGMGGGDPKLLAAIGAWLGIAALPGVVLTAALCGLGWAGLQALRGRAAGGTTPIPLGTMLALAALAWLALGWLALN
jgi:leader peptidase (prepilin peptidase)/N-methyltransferase